ncbi:hypothetical protein [Gimesia sp.]|uniref:hypothetical protein n=1 Tax=Gimesia sp. TaxID=2024833 RepID=UPI0032ECD954
MIHQYDDLEIRSQQRAKSVTDKVEQESASGMCQYVEEQPVKSVFIGLGAGLGAGLLLGALFRESTRYLYHEPGIAERVGNQVKDSLSEIFPSSLKSHFRS